MTLVNGKSWTSDLMIFRFDLWPLLQRQTRIAKLKRAYNSLIIASRGFGCETNLLEVMD